MEMAVKMSPLLYGTSPVRLSAQKLRTRRICCSGGGEGGISDAVLSSELAARMKAHSVEAMRKSKKLLFGELCEYMGLNEEQAQQKWRSMDEDNKWVLVRAFLQDWASHFHPLSARSTKDMLDEYLRLHPPNPPSSPFFFSRLLHTIIGFP